MSSEIEEKLKEAEARRKFGLRRIADVGANAGVHHALIAVEMLIEAGRLMDEQITLCQQTISLLNAAIKQTSARLRVVEEMSSELECGEAEQV